MYTRWVIGGEVQDIRYRSQVVAELEFMHGDADGYSTEEIPVKHDDVVEFANFLVRCGNTTPESSGGPGYRTVEGYERFGRDFPRDLSYDCEASLVGYNFFYYDAFGRKSHVKLETD